MDKEVPDSPDEIERQIETDPTLIPRRPSALLVEPSVLDQAELEALLLDLGPLLDAAMNDFADGRHNWRSCPRFRRSRSLL